jgi:hypothetical protein
MQTADGRARFGGRPHFAADDEIWFFFNDTAQPKTKDGMGIDD